MIVPTLEKVGEAGLEHVPIVGQVDGETQCPTYIALDVALLEPNRFVAPTADSIIMKEEEGVKIEALILNQRN